MSEVLQILISFIFRMFLLQMPQFLQHKPPSFSRMTKHQKRLKRWWSLGRFKVLKPRRKTHRKAMFSHLIKDIKVLLG
jgi:hypothetical protein